MFLDNINTDLFRPLVSKNSRLYGLGLWAIYQKLVKERISGECTPSEARGIIRRELQMSVQTIEWAQEEEEKVSDSQTMAMQIYAVLRECGWIVEMDENGYRRIVYMPLISSRLLVAIQSVSAGRNFSMGATFHGVFLNLKAALDRPREAASQVNYAAEAARRLRDELNTVIASTREISHRMRDKKIGAKLFQTFFIDFLEGALGSYDQIKINSNPHRYRSETLSVATSLVRDKDTIKLMAETIAKENGNTDYDAATEQLEHDLHDIHMVFFSVPELMEHIERYRSTTTRRTREAMQYAYKAIPDIGIQIESTVAKLGAARIVEDELLPALVLRDEYVAAHRCRTPKEVACTAEPTPHKHKTPKLWDIAFNRAYDDYLNLRADNPERLDTYLRRQMGTKRRVTTDELAVENLDDLMAYMQLRELLHNCVPENSIYQALSKRYRVKPVPGAITENEYITAPTLTIALVGHSEGGQHA